MSVLAWTAHDGVVPEELTEGSVKRLLLGQLQAYRDELEVMNRDELREHFKVTETPVFNYGGQKYAVRCVRLTGLCLAESNFKSTNWRPKLKARCLEIMLHHSEFYRYSTPSCLTAVHEVRLSGTVYDSNRYWRSVHWRVAHVKHYENTAHST